MEHCAAAKLSARMTGYNAMCTFTRTWAMPNANTFSVKPIGDLVRKYLHGVSVDPFARDSGLATYTNDLNPQTTAQYHMDAVVFLQKLAIEGVKADVVIFDPPYSPRQISECYAAAGKKARMVDTQNAALYATCRTAIRKICGQGSLVLSFGWNSCGMGPGWETEEIMLVAHGGAHNDTICMVERLQFVQEDIWTSQNGK
jgi:hypothetical protein